MMLMYVVQNYNKELEPLEIPQHLAVDLNELKYTVNRLIHIYIIIVPVFLLHL